MCKAMEQMRAESREEGIAIGVDKGISIGVEQNKAESIKKLVAKGFTETEARDLLV